MKNRLLILTALAALAIPASARNTTGIVTPPRSVEASDAAYAGAVLITWTKVPGAESYRIFRSASHDWTTARPLGVTSDTAFLDPALSRNARQVYHYWVMAEAGRAVSALSEPDSGRIRPGTALAQHKVRQNFRRLRGQLLK